MVNSRSAPRGMMFWTFSLYVGASSVKGASLSQEYNTSITTAT